MGRPVRATLQLAAEAVLSRLHTAPASADARLQQAASDKLMKVVDSLWQAARGAQADWSTWRLQDRLKVLRRLRLAIADDPRALAMSVHRRNLAETMAAEVLPLLDACRFLEGEAPRILRERKLGGRGRPTWLWGNSVVLRPEPLGVVLIIGPSNYPLMLPGIQAIQAVAAGNSVLIKPAVAASSSIEQLLSLARSAGLPEGVLQILPEEPEAASLAIRKGVDKVFLTGSASTGRAVSHELAESTTPSVMELSGCDAAFVLEDADLNLVSDCLLLGLTLNHSQTCMAPRRVFVRHRQADELLRLLKTKLDRRFRAASDQRDQQAALDRSSATTQSDGNRTSTAALRRDRMREQLIAAAIQEGAELIVGSIAGGSHEEQIEVAILDRVSSQMSITQQDLFAPVLSVIRVESDSQSLQENARCPFALSATVFGSKSSCQEFARRIPAGCVVINDMIVPSADPRVPFGGRLASGHGKTRGETGLLEMTHLKAIVASRPWFKPHLHQPTVADLDVLEQLIRLEHAAGPLQSLRSLPKMIHATIQQVRLRSKLKDSLQARSTQGTRS